MPRKGRLGKEDQAYIRASAYKVPVEEIAAKLDKTPEMVQRYIEDHVPVPKGDKNSERLAIRQGLRRSLAWQQLNDEFTPKEIEYFEEEFAKMMSQFKGDVLPTEEKQIFQLIKFEILMNRNLKARQRAVQDIAELREMQKGILDAVGGDRTLLGEADKERLLEYQTAIENARAADNARTKEYKELHSEHSDLMKTLKGTRDQRIKQIESSKVSFLGLLKMLQDKDARDVEGEFMGVMDAASKKEWERLAKPYKYADGNEDQPLLTAETVEFLDHAADGNRDESQARRASDEVPTSQVS